MRETERRGRIPLIATALTGTLMLVLAGVLATAGLPGASLSPASMPRPGGTIGSAPVRVSGSPHLSLRRQDARPAPSSAPPSAGVSPGTDEPSTVAASPAPSSRTGERSGVNAAPSPGGDGTDTAPSPGMGERSTIEASPDAERAEAGAFAPAGPSRTIPSLDGSPTPAPTKSRGTKMRPDRQGRIPGRR